MPKHASFLRTHLRKVVFLAAILILISVGFIIDGRNNKALATGYSSGDVLISEFTTTGTPWIELLNTTGSDINLASSTWQIVLTPLGPGQTTTTLSGIIPANGLLTVGVIGNFMPNGVKTMITVLWSGTNIFTMSYGTSSFGGEPHVAEPGPAQSGIMIGTSSPHWGVTSSVSQGWFNETANTMDCNNPPVPGAGQPPSLAAIVACIHGITTNMADTSTIPDPTHASGLYFSTSTNGKIDYGSTVLNLTDQNTRTLLETLGTNMKIDGGKIGLDASSSALMRNPTNNITISFYNMKSRGYENMDTTSIRVKDDSGNYIPTSSPNFPSLAGMSWNPGSNGGTFSFGSNHFSEYDINPTVVEVIPVPTPSTNTLPNYTFGTNVTGTAVFGGDCAMASTSTINGNNTVTFGPLGAGTHSNCTVKVIDSFGASTTLAVTSFTINSSNPPGTITGLTAAPASQNQINLSWTATSSATYYKLYGGTNSSSLPFVASTTGATYNNTGLATGTLYYYKISGVNSNGEGASSTAVSTTTLDIPAQPTGLALTPVSQTQINLNWNSAAGVNYYNIYRGLTFMSMPWVASTTNPSSYNDTGLATNTNYTYQISAVNVVGESVPSGMVNTSTFPITPPAAPTGLTVTPTSTSVILLSWNATTNTDYYKINHAINWPMYIILATTTGLTYSHGSLGANTAHYYKITAVNGGGQTDSADAGPYYTFAAVPAGLAATASTSNSISLQWGDNGNPDGTVYQISGTGFATVTTTATSTAISGLGNPNSSYTFNVQSQNGDGVLSSAVSVTDWTKPKDPSGLTLTGSNTSSLSFSWSANNNPAGTYYHLGADNFPGSYYTTSTSYTVTGLTPSTTYTNIVVTALSHEYPPSASYISAGSSIVSATTPATPPPNAPTNVYAQPTSTSAIIIGWTAFVTNTTDYFRVYSSTSNWGFLLIGTTTPSVTTFTHTGLGASTKHFYYVSAVNSGGETNCDGTYVSYTLPNPPTSLVITASSSNSLTASWNANGNGDNSTDNTQYEIYKDGVAVSPQVITTSSVISSLNPNTQYSIVVKAQNGGGYLSTSSSAAVEWTRPADPQSLVLTASTSNSLTFSWNANNNPAGTYYNLNNADFGSIYTTSTTYTVSPLPSATTFTTITVRAVSHEYPSQSYTSGGDTLASASTQANNPASLVTTASTTNSVSLQWNANGNAGGTVYQISGGPSTVTTTATSTTINPIPVGLSPNTSYTFTVKAQNPDGSFTSGVSVTDWTKANNPSSFISTASSSNAISFSWSGGVPNANPLSTVYQLFGNNGFATTTASGTTTTASSLIPNTSYLFGIRSQNNDGTYNATVTTTDYTKAAVPSTPTAAAAGATSISLSWSANSNPSTTIYYVYGGPSTVTTTAVATTITGLATSTSYQFAVKAKDIGDANYSALSASSTAASTWGLPAVTTLAASSVASTSASLNGNITSMGGEASIIDRGFNVGTTTSYFNNFSEGPGFFGTGSFNHIWSILTPGTVYHYQARAQNSVGLATGSDVMFISTFAPTVGNPTSTITSADSATCTVAVPLSVTNATVDLSSLTSANSTTLPGLLSVDAATALGTVQITIPSGTKITADEAWSGIINLPTVKDSSAVTVTADSGKTVTPSSISVVEIGFGDVKLTFDRGVRILIPGKAGSDAGYYRDGVFTKITAACASDSQATGDGLAAGADCKIDIGGSDLVIWTKHFTMFITYSQTTNSTGNGGGGGSAIPVNIVRTTTPSSGIACPALVAGDMVKVTGKPAIYALNSNLEVLYFPSGDEFKSWRPTYGGYQSITQGCFDSLKVPVTYPGAVNYHPGSYVVKRAGSSQLYVVEPNNTLAKITSAAATALYGKGYKVMSIAVPFWPHYVNRGTDINTAVAHPGMLVKVDGVTYYVDTNNQLREVSSAGMTANGFQTQFVHTLSSTATAGLTTSAKIEAAVSTLTDKTQSSW